MSEAQEAIALANRALDRPNCDPDDDLCVLARQLLRLREAMAWQTIETAPKDGTKVLLSFDPPFHDSLENGFVTGSWVYDVWWLSSIWASTIAHKAPTRWQPLPAASPAPQDRESK